jgi:hypothetical protein
MAANFHLSNPNANGKDAKYDVVVWLVMLAPAGYRTM